MEKQRLIETLKQLRAELTQTERVDPETLAELEKLTDELNRALDERHEKPPADLEPTTSGLRGLLLRYEAEHPQLAVSIGRVADALQGMGF